MISEHKVGPLTIRGLSLGGVYTSVHVPELNALFDVGIPIRSFAGIDHIFISHGHGDHIGSLASLLGVRGLLHRKKPPTVYLPAEIADQFQQVLCSMEALQRHSLEVELSPVSPGDEIQLRDDLWVRTFKTHHPVPSVGYQFFDRVKKLRAEFANLDGKEIGRRRKAGEDIFRSEERLEFAYATDTLIRVLDTNPQLLESRVLMLECTFLDERKSLEKSRAGCHIHMDELLEYADKFNNEHLVLMHFSQLYGPDEVRSILKKRLPKELYKRTTAFVPEGAFWPK